MAEKMSLFVPGRLCVLGEHCDWAAGYRSQNPNVPVGEAIVTGIDQGLFAECRKLQEPKFVYRTTLNAIVEQPFETDYDPAILLAEAQSGSPFSYIAGVIFQLLQRFPDLAVSKPGLEVSNHETSLPVKKGLSSSAALCVLIVRSFNHTLKLGLSIEEEMELAYLGEITTPSRCGRLDQACAFGTRPIRITFDSDQISVKPIAFKCTLFFVIVDLGAYKDTHEILKSLNNCYPFSQTEIHEKVHHFLGTLSPSITLRAITAMENGDASTVGQLMIEAQQKFDEYVAPACPAQLTSPILHQLLAYPPLKLLYYGAKGVGSQGDGSAQFLAKDEASQHNIISVINHDFPQMTCLPFTLRPAS